MTEVHIIFLYFSTRSILTLLGTRTLKINRKSLTILKESQTRRSYWSHIMLYSPSQISFIIHAMRFISEKTETAVPTKTKTCLSFSFFFHCHHRLVLFYIITNHLHYCTARINNHKLYPPYTCRSILSWSCESPIGYHSARIYLLFILVTPWG